MKKIRIAEHNGNYFLIGPDGYTTTRKNWKLKKDAEKALEREQKLEDAGKPSKMIWEY